MEGDSICVGLFGEHFWLKFDFNKFINATVAIGTKKVIFLVLV